MNNSALAKKRGCGILHGSKLMYVEFTMPPHPAFFVKKSVYEKYGLFRLDCGINAGYELMLRFLGVF